MSPTIAPQALQLKIQNFARLHVEASAEKLARFLGAAVDLMKVMAWACGHDDLQKFNLNDLTTWKREMVELSGVRFGGVGGSSR